ncbi:MAG: BACON domain-containing protein [Alistipes sp.]
MKNWIKTMLVVSALCLVACSDDPDVSPLKRDTDAVQLTYNAAATSQFTVRFNGSWETRVACGAEGATDVPAWFTVSPANGVGNGSDYQYVTVTAERNAGDKRVGYVYVRPTNGEELKITVTQADGHFSIEKPVVEGDVKMNRVSSGLLVVAYDKAFSGQKVEIATTLSGISGLTVKTPFEGVIEQEGRGQFAIPITGTATAMGALKVAVVVKLDGVEVYNDNIAVSVGSPNEKHTWTFSSFIWGGDYVADKEGFSPTGKEADKASTGLETEKKTCTPGTNGSSDVFKTMSEEYRKNRNVADWDGYGIYERPGYLRFGTGGKDGWLLTPALSALTSTPQKIVVSVDLCRVVGEEGDIMISAEGGGTVISGGTISTAVLPVPNAVSECKWQTCMCVVADATSATRIKIAMQTPSGGKEGGRRFQLDNLVIMSEDQVVLKDPLAAPDMKTLDVTATSSSFDLQWATVKNADAYDVELIDVTRPQFSFKRRVTEPKITIVNILSGYYSLHLTAIWAADEKMNSAMATKSLATLGVRTDPLDAPTDLKYTNSGYAMTATWALVDGATGYTVSLLDGEKTVESADVQEGTYTFAGLEGGEKAYTLSVVATFKANPELNSAAATLAVKTLPHMIAPVATLYAKTHGLAVIEWTLSTDALTQQPVANYDNYDFRLKDASGKILEGWSYDNDANFNFGKYNRYRYTFGALNSGTAYKMEMRRVSTADKTKWVDSEWVSVAVSTDAAPAKTGYLFYKDFENVPFGAQALLCAYGRGGFSGTEDFSDITKIVWTKGDKNWVYCPGAYYANASFCAAYMPEWDAAELVDEDLNKNAHIAVGYMKFGGGSKPGWLTLPKLSTLTAATDIVLEMDACPYYEPSKDGTNLETGATDGANFFIEVTGGGTIAEVNGVANTATGAVTLTSQTAAETNANGLGRYTFTNHKLKITGATAATRIKIFTGTASTPKGQHRMWMDNIKIKAAN